MDSNGITNIIDLTNRLKVATEEVERLFTEQEGLFAREPREIDLTIDFNNCFFWRHFRHHFSLVMTLRMINATMLEDAKTQYNDVVAEIEKIK